MSRKDPTTLSSNLHQGKLGGGVGGGVKQKRLNITNMANMAYNQQHEKALGIAVRKNLKYM